MLRRGSGERKRRGTNGEQEIPLKKKKKRRFSK
jgi:hypothetical protein